MWVMASMAAAATAANAAARNIPAQPDTVERVANQILYVSGLDTQAFSGSENPSSIYRRMHDGVSNVFTYYRELEEKDLCISSALETRKILALAREWKIQPADDANGQAMQYAQEAQAFLESIPNFRWALWEMFDAPGYGLTVQEILWRINSDGSIGVDKIVGRPQELFSFGAIGEPQNGPLRLANYPGAQGELVPAAKFIVSTYQPRNSNRRGRPLLRRLFWPSWFIRNVLTLNLRHLEKGNGTVVVKYPPGAGAEDKSKAEEAARAIAKEIAAAVPQNFELVSEALQNTRTRDAEDFKSIRMEMREEMTRMILGQTGSTRSGEGGYSSEAASDVHLSVLWEYIRNDWCDGEETLNEQLLAPWLVWRFGPQALDRAVRPYFRADKEPPTDRAAELDLLTKARNLGTEVPKREVYEKGGIRTPDRNAAGKVIEEVLPPPALSMGLLDGLPAAQPGANE